MCEHNKRSDLILKNGASSNHMNNTSGHVTVVQEQLPEQTDTDTQRNSVHQLSDLNRGRCAELKGCRTVSTGLISAL